MLPRNEHGEFITIKNAFHSLNTRLFKLKRGIEDIQEVEADFRSVIKDLESLVLGYSPNDVLSHISYSLSLITEIRELGTGIVKGIEGPWALTAAEESQVYNTLDNELSFFESSLKDLESKFTQQQDFFGQHIVVSGLEKIKTTISVPQLSWLMKFLMDKDEGIFVGPRTQLCRGFSDIIMQENGDDISSNTLYNKCTEESSMKSSLEFWRERFRGYEIKCTNILREKGFA